MSAPLVIPAMRLASKSASGSKKSSAGSKPSPGCARPVISGGGARRLDVYLCIGRLQSGADAQPLERRGLSQGGGLRPQRSSTALAPIMGTRHPTKRPLPTTWSSLHTAWAEEIYIDQELF